LLSVLHLPSLTRAQDTLDKISDSKSLVISLAIDLFFVGNFLRVIL
jgi:hypothetical protein